MAEELLPNLQAALQIYGPYPLHKTTILGHKKNLIFLLEHGMSPNSSNFDGLTPLHEACLQDRVDFAEILLKYGANVNAVSVDVRTYM
ncbi:hypothetical protein AVEN_258601-1 [Araneus ventricosus]|uniref:Uncharacterized protein n=1 Tax=Araneus ventricosus TaxID=182803 RepID=A0A4Y2JLI4_ARAVE|nr:hypothetical protein AVEN_258601-1 [Araneus ventricosus]